MNVKDTPALQIRAYPILETHQDKFKKKLPTTVEQLITV